MTSPRDALLAKMAELLDAYETSTKSEVVVGAYLTFGEASDHSDSEEVWEWDGREFSPKDYLEVRVKPSAQAKVVSTGGGE